MQEPGQGDRGTVVDGTGRRWRGLAMAERQLVRRRALVDAAYGLIGTVGWAATTVRGVCSAANLNPRYFYESFADLDQLLLAVYDHVVAEGIEALAAATDGGRDVATLVRQVVGAGFRFLAEDPRRARVLFVEGAGHRALERKRFDTMLAMADHVKALGATVPPVGALPALGATVPPVGATVPPVGTLPALGATVPPVGATSGTTTGPRAARPRRGGASPGPPRPDGAKGLPDADGRIDRLGTVAANLLVGGVTELCVAWLDGRLDMTLDELADDVTDLAVGTAETAARLAAARLADAGPATGLAAADPGTGLAAADPGTRPPEPPAGASPHSASP